MVRALLSVVALMTTFVTRCDPPTHSCPQWEPLLEQFSPGWDVGRMSSIMWRESRCDPTAYNRAGRAVGLLQIVPINFAYLAGQLGQPVYGSALFDPTLNVRAAAELYEYWGGYRAWAT